MFNLSKVAKEQNCSLGVKKSRTSTKKLSELTRLSDFLIIARVKFRNLLHCSILFAKKCGCFVFENFQTHTHNENWKIIQAYRF